MVPSRSREIGRILHELVGETLGWQKMRGDGKRGVNLFIGWTGVFYLLRWMDIIRTRSAFRENSISRYDDSSLDSRRRPLKNVNASFFLPRHVNRE